MDNNYLNPKELLEALMAPIILALFGGAARACRQGIKSWRKFCGSMIVSAFTGVLVHLMIQETGLSTSTQAAIVAASGYSGGAILDALAAGLVQQFSKLQNVEDKGVSNDQEQH